MKKIHLNRVCQPPDNGRPVFNDVSGHVSKPLLPQHSLSQGSGFSLLSETLPKNRQQTLSNPIFLTDRGKRPPLPPGRDPTGERGGGDEGRRGWREGEAQRWRSQRQMEASSHTAIRMLLSRLKLVWRMAEVHRGSVRVMHLERAVT